eukprot:gb/GECG01016206.1/.p1 GENE.gb/GECG01016206.1/~~gb/GECG01016206.1/.p1  ORF type:complete len:499 (+),score=77.17 gb/GECG01016206.1/:1-1497(+)
MRGVGVALIAAILVVAAMESSGAEDAPEQSSLTRIQGDKFHQQILEDDDVSFVYVSASGDVCPHCINIQNTLDKTARNVAGLVNFGIINFNEAVEDSEGDYQRIVDLFEVFNATQEQIALPGLLIYGYGPKKLDQALTVPPQVLLQLSQYGAKTMWQQLKPFVPSLSRTVDERRLSEFLDDRPALPHVLLFTKNLGASALYKKLSLDYDRRAVFGEASNHMEKLAKAFGVTEYPTLLVGPSGYDSAPPEELKSKSAKVEDVPQTYRWKKYDGAMNYNDLAAFIDKHVDPFTAPVIRSIGDFDKYCEQKGGVCLIGVTSSRIGKVNNHEEASTFSQAADRAYVRSDMEEAARGGNVQVERLPINFALLEGGAQTEFIEVFDIPITPAVVAINPRKKRYSVMKGAFDSGTIRHFVLDLLDGNVPQQELPKMPRLVNTSPVADSTADQKGAGQDTAQGGDSSSEEPKRARPKKISSKKKKKKTSTKSDSKSSSSNSGKEEL